MGFLKKIMNVVNTGYNRISDYFSSPESKKKKLHAAIKSGNEKRVRSLLPYCEEDTEHPFITDAVRYGSKNIVELILEKWGFAYDDTSLQEAVYRKNDAIFNVLLDNGANVNALGENKDGAIHNAIFYGKNNYVESIINHPTFNLSKADKKHHTLCEAALYSRNSIAKLLIDKGANLDEEVYENLSSRNIFALNDDARNALKEMGDSQDDIEDYIAVSRSKAALNLSYSNDSFGARKHFLRKIISRTFKDSNFSHKDDVLKILDSVDARNAPLKLNNGHHLTIRTAGYQEHAAYFITEHNRNNQPIKITYCDGNNFLNRTDSNYYNGAISFNIDPAKMKSLSRTHHDWKDYLHKAFDCDISSTYANNGEKFLNIMSKLVVCDKKGKPIITDESIPTKSQKRGNCTLKAFNILFRQVMGRLNPKLEFNNINDTQQGNGYDLYQNYKSHLTTKPINQLLALASNEKTKDKPSHLEALDFLQGTVFPKAIAKNNINLLEQLQHVFNVNHIHLHNLVEELPNKTFKSANKETLQWLDDCQNPPTIQDSPSNTTSAKESTTLINPQEKEESLTA
jgi:hypothetical protein